MKTENLEINKYKMTFEVDAEKFEEGLVKSYNKNKNNINIQGFRKGKAPRKMIEAQYGKEIFFDDAINFVLPEAYENAIKESNLITVSRPQIDVESVSAEQGIVFTAIVYTKPDVTIDDFKNITYKPLSVEVTEEEIESHINKEREKNARIISVTDRPVQLGDIVNINFEGVVDGVAFEGGNGKDFDLEIGSKTFIDTFEEQLIGHSVGDDLEVNVTFPENYHSEELKGKKALFKVEIIEIKFKELPELNDEFAQDVSEFDTLKEYKNSILEKIKENKVKEANTDKENQVIDKLIERASMQVPEVMIDNQVEQLINDFTNRLKSQGMSMDMYLQYMGQTMDSLKEVYRANAEKQVKGRLVLEKIAKNENIEVSEDELKAELIRMSNYYNMDIEKLESVMRPEDMEGLKMDLKINKAVELVLGAAVEE